MLVVHASERQHSFAFAFAFAFSSDFQGWRLDLIFCIHHTDTACLVLFKRTSADETWDLYCDLFILELDLGIFDVQLHVHFVLILGFVSQGNEEGTIVAIFAKIDSLVALTPCK